MAGLTKVWNRLQDIRQSNAAANDLRWGQMRQLWDSGDPADREVAMRMMTEDASQMATAGVTGIGGLSGKAVSLNAGVLAKAFRSGKVSASLVGTPTEGLITRFRTLAPQLTKADQEIAVKGLANAGTIPKIHQMLVRVESKLNPMGSNWATRAINKTNMAEGFWKKAGFLIPTALVGGEIGRRLGKSYFDYRERVSDPTAEPVGLSRSSQQKLSGQIPRVVSGPTATPYQPPVGIGNTAVSEQDVQPSQPQDIAQMLQEAYQSRFGALPQEGNVGWGFRMGPAGYKPNYAGDYRAQVLGASTNDPRLNRQYNQQVVEEQMGMQNAGQQLGLIGQLGMTNLTRDQQAMLQRQMTRDDVERGRAPLIRQVASERTQRLIDKANAKASMRGPAGFSIDKTAAAYVANEGLGTDEAYQKAIEQYQTLRQ